MRRMLAIARRRAAATAGAATSPTRPSSSSTITRDAVRSPVTGQRWMIPPIRDGACLGDPGAAHRNREGETRQMATETARTEVPPDVTEHLTTEDRTGLLRAMLMMRGIEERAMTLYRQGKVPGSFYDGFGQEAVSAGATWA